MLELAPKDKTSILMPMGINLLEVPRSHWLKEPKDIHHYNVFSQFLVENMSFSNFVILNGGKQAMSNFTCFSSMGGASVIDYLIGDPNCLRNSFPNFSMDNK